MSQFPAPPAGDRIRYENGTIVVPDRPVVPFVEGDGTGPDIWKATVRVIDAAVEKAYGGKKKIVWYEVFAGEKANSLFGEWLPDRTVQAVRKFRVAIKGPLTTPVGGGIRSLYVALRQLLDLYACVRPVKWIPGVPSPVIRPQDLDVVIYRENTEDVYAGIEWASGSPEAGKLIEYIRSELGKKIRPDSGIGIKPISEFGTKRLVRMAIMHAITSNRKSVTLVHKGDIMKFVPEPFPEIGKKLGLEGEEVLERVRKLKEAGIIRRFRARINQRQLGITVPMPLSHGTATESRQEKWDPGWHRTPVSPTVTNGELYRAGGITPCIRYIMDSRGGRLKRRSTGLQNRPACPATSSSSAPVSSSVSRMSASGRMGPEDEPDHAVPPRQRHGQCRHETPARKRDCPK